MKSSQNVLHLRTSYIILKVSRKNPEERKAGSFGPRKVERNTRKGKMKQGRKQWLRRNNKNNNIIIIFLSYIIIIYYIYYRLYNILLGYRAYVIYYFIII